MSSDALVSEGVQQKVRTDRAGRKPCVHWGTRLR